MLAQSVTEHCGDSAPRQLHAEQSKELLTTELRRSQRSATRSCE